jgi:NitT/TauT family transport system substrate-binding protein
MLGKFAGAFVALLALSSPLSAVELNVTSFGVSMHGVPYAVAKENGYFKEAGIDVSGFLTSSGGGTTVRNVLASDLPYGEVALPAVVAAIQQGVKLSIIHGGVRSAADQLWVTRKDDKRISSPTDLKNGMKLGYSSPFGVTDILSRIMLDKYKLEGKVERRAVGGLGAGLTALRESAIDMNYMFEPTWSRNEENYRLAFSSVIFAPNVMQTVGIARTDFLEANPQLIRGIITARRKAVVFIQQHPTQAAKIMAKYYNMKEDLAEKAISNILKADKHYWSEGEFDLTGMDFIVNGMKLAGSIQKIPDWETVVDQSYLPDDLKVSLKH